MSFRFIFNIHKIFGAVDSLFHTKKSVLYGLFGENKCAVKCSQHTNSYMETSAFNQSETTTKKSSLNIVNAKLYLFILCCVVEHYFFAIGFKSHLATIFFIIQL